MKTINKATILGNLTRDPEVKNLNNDPNGKPILVARFTVATSEPAYKKQDGTEVPERAQFHRIVAWRGLAEVTQKYLHKGDSVYIEGQIEYSEVEKDGVKKNYVDIIADELSIVRSKDGQQAQQQPQAQPQWQQPMPQPQAAPPQYPQFQPMPPQYPHQYGQMPPQYGGGYPQQAAPQQVPQWPAQAPANNGDAPF